MLQYYFWGIVIGIAVVNIIYVNTKIWDRMEEL